MNLQSDQFSKYLEILSIDKLTKIQSLCIEPLYNNKSVFGLAPTGSGKTLAFILPLLLKIDCLNREHQTLILVPTRELGNQIASVANKVSNAIFTIDKKNILIRTAFGGTPIASQVEELSKKPHVIIATPGRVLDLLQREALSFSNLKNLILDEADIMVGMGFSDQVEAICNHLPVDLQVGLFSATKNEKVTLLEKLLLKNAKYITAKIDNEENDASENDLQPPTISHFYILTSKEGKFKNLKNLLKNVENKEINKGIIFCHTRETSHQLAESLKNEGFEAEALTGELGQVHRNSIMRNFKTGNLKFLVATNIASRGIDISKLPLVIHYDIPYTNEEYIHRSGRTGRAGNSGSSITICEEKNLNYYLNMMQEIGLATKKYSYENIINLENTDLAVEKSRKKISFVKMYINKGKQDKMRPGDILGALIKELSFTKEDIGNIFIFDNFTHVEVNEDKKELLKNSKFKIKNLQVKISEAK